MSDIQTNRAFIEKISALGGEINTPKQSKAQLVEALQGIVGLIESGQLVRDISHDSEEGYAMRMLDLVRTISAGHKALADAEAE